jgi:hypothetical protein
VVDPPKAVVENLNLVVEPRKPVVASHEPVVEAPKPMVATTFSLKGYHQMGGGQIPAGKGPLPKNLNSGQ